MRPFGYLLSLLIVTTPAMADFKTGGDAYKQGDYETAAKEFLPLAENGDHRAMYALGSMYAAGHGVPQDLKESFKWFQKAARYGRPDAEYKIGLMYANGLGVEQNDRRALNWLGKSAKKGFASAQYQVGLMYMEGRGVEQDYIKAYAWSDLALNQGYTKAGESVATCKENLTPEQLQEAQAMSASFKEEYKPFRY